MRSMWKGAISFGLIMIPVKLYTATETQDIAFRQVHREDGGRIRFRRVCSIDGTEVPYEDVAKGFELPTGEMVVLTEDDMADLPLPTTRSIEVLHFAAEDQIDPILFSRSYFVEPEKAGMRAYVLLRDALERSGKVAVVQVALRQRESLAALRTRDGVLVLETLLWPDEVREPTSLADALKASSAAARDEHKGAGPRRPKSVAAGPKAKGPAGDATGSAPDRRRARRRASA